MLKSISAISSSIAGDDTIRTLPYVDSIVTRNNPKMFMGYSESIINHLMVYRAGSISFYSPTIMCEFGEYVELSDYPKLAVKDILFSESADYSLIPNPKWSDDHISWDERNTCILRNMKEDGRG